MPSFHACTQIYFLVLDVLVFGFSVWTIWIAKSALHSHWASESKSPKADSISCQELEYRATFLDMTCIYIYIYMIWVLARSLQKMTFLDSLRLLNMLCWAAQSMCSPTGLRDSPTLGHLRTKSGTTPFSERWKGYHPKNSYWNYWSWHFQPRRLVQIPRTGVAAIDYH